MSYNPLFKDNPNPPTPQKIYFNNELKFNEDQNIFFENYSTEYKIIIIIINQTEMSQTLYFYYWKLLIRNFVVLLKQTHF